MVRRWEELNKAQQTNVLEVNLADFTEENINAFIKLVSKVDYYFDSEGKAYAGPLVEYCLPGKYCSQPIYENNKLSVQKLISK